MTKYIERVRKEKKLLKHSINVCRPYGEESSPLTLLKHVYELRTIIQIMLMMIFHFSFFFFLFRFYYDYSKIIDVDTYNIHSYTHIFSSYRVKYVNIDSIKMWKHLKINCKFNRQYGTIRGESRHNKIYQFSKCVRRRLLDVYFMYSDHIGKERKIK